MAPEKGWYYVQNTSGEGMLMPMDQSAQISKPFGWGGSQPWWGLTDLRRGMAERLDSFRNPDGDPGFNDATVYACRCESTARSFRMAATLRRPEITAISFCELTRT